MIRYAQSGSAIFSTDRRYRYALTRRFASWPESKRTLVVIGLNPSTADEANDDPTIRRCVGFAQREACSQLIMVNLYGHVMTDSIAFAKFAARSPRAIGPQNDRTLHSILTRRDELIVVAAWGAIPATLHERARHVRTLIARWRPSPLFPPVQCFGLNKDASPKHPLYLRADTPLVSYTDGLIDEILRGTRAMAILRGE